MKVFLPLEALSGSPLADTPAEAEARAAAVEAGVAEVARTLGTFRVRMRLRWLSYIGLSAWVAAVMGAHVGAIEVVAAIAALLVIGWVLQWTPARVVVGTDGIDIRWLWTRRFVPLASVEAVSEAGCVLLEIDTGEQLVFESCPEMAEWIRAARAHLRATPRGPLDPSLRRSGAAPSEWIRRLRTRLAPCGSVHRIGVSDANVDAAWSVLCDPRAPGADRAASAISLEPTCDAVGLARLRDVTRSTAAPTLRAALEAIAERAGDERIAALMSALEAEDREADERLGRLA